MLKLLNAKPVLIFLLILLLWIPLQMIQGIVSERESYRYQARSDIERSWTGAQQLVGPLLVVPYSLVWSEDVRDERNDTTRTYERRSEHRMVIAPEELEIDARLQTEQRQRGLYNVPVYTADIALQGQFDLMRVRQLEQRYADDNRSVEWSTPYLGVLLSDLRGSVNRPLLDWNGQQVRFDSPARLEKAGQGMHAELPNLTGQVSSFSLQLQLRGMESLSFAPVGGETRVNLTSGWPHPSFIGKFLPIERAISNEGFTARWVMAAFSSNMVEKTNRCAEGNCQSLLESSFGVSLLNTVDIYQQAERALKYGLLFIILTFALFFVYETLRGLRLHPMQYLLVGLALSVFYLLLVSLSEHIDFGLAYFISQAACAALLGTYVSGVLRCRLSGAIFGVLTSLLYGVLYVILRSEDNALLMGSLLIFAMLAGTMLATRKVDWYRLGESDSVESPEECPMQSSTV